MLVGKPSYVILLNSMDTLTAGYREIEHTADWELEVWAPSLEELLSTAARGMYALSGIRLAPGPRVARHIQVEGSDEETLLVSFLSELLYLEETEGLAFDEIHLKIEGLSLSAELRGAPIAQMNKEIKAVTYHNLKVQHRNGRLYVRIVFDV